MKATQGIIDDYIWQLSSYYEAQVEQINKTTVVSDKTIGTLEKMMEFIGVEPVKESIKFFTRKAYIINAYTFLERMLISLCHTAEKETEMKFSLDDLKGNGVRRCLLYLTKGFEISITNEEFISDLNKIRNNLVHNDAFIEKKKIEKILERNDGITLVNSRLDFTDDYIHKCLSNVRSALMEVLLSLIDRSIEIY